MKPIWDFPFASRIAHSRLTGRFWKVVQPAYHKFLKTIWYRKGVPKRIGHHEFRLCLTNRRLQTWLPETETNWMLRSIRTNQTILDIGASFGLESIIFARAASPNGRVYSFEPSPATFQCLRDNVRLNQMESVITPIHSAVGNAEGTIDFYLDDDPLSMAHSAVRTSTANQPSVSVPVTTIDRFCQQHRIQPAVLKIDVEGFEPLVLEGARELIANLPAIVIFVELHPWAWAELDYTELRFHQLIATLGLTATDIDGKPYVPSSNRSHIRLVRIL